jgi:hypothetical protein
MLRPALALRGVLALLALFIGARAFGRFAVALSIRAGVFLLGRFPAAFLLAGRLAVLRAPARFRPADDVDDVDDVDAFEPLEALRFPVLVEVAFFRFGALRLAM